MPGTHQRFLSYFIKQNIPSANKILDLGAGHGAFTKQLHEMGYNVTACDLFPEMFYFAEIECKKADITVHIPYTENSFDVVIAVEVSEHIPDHEVFFNEVNRILKPGGYLLLSTPNILSFKSRIKFLFSGFFYSFGALEYDNYNGLQHVASLTIDQYNYIAVKNGFSNAEIDIDKKQNTSTWLFIILYPFVWLHCRLHRASMMHNRVRILLGRLLFMKFKNLKHEKSAAK